MTTIQWELENSEECSFVLNTNMKGGESNMF